MGVYIRIKNKHFYLDTIKNRRHYWGSLHMKESSDPAERREQMKLAEKCRAKREMQLVCGEWNLIDTLAGKKAYRLHA